MQGGNKHTIEGMITGLGGIIKRVRKVPVRFKKKKSSLFYHITKKKKDDPPSTVTPPHRDTPPLYRDTPLPHTCLELIRANFVGCRFFFTNYPPSIS